MNPEELEQRMQMVIRPVGEPGVRGDPESEDEGYAQVEAEVEVERRGRKTRVMRPRLGRRKENKSEPEWSDLALLMLQTQAKELGLERVVLGGLTAICLAVAGATGSITKQYQQRVQPAIAMSANVVGSVADTMTGRTQQRIGQELHEALKKSADAQQKAFESLGLELPLMQKLVREQAKANERIPGLIAEAVAPRVGVDVGLRIGARTVPQHSQRRISESSDETRDLQRDWNRLRLGGSSPVELEAFVEVYLDVKLPLWRAGEKTNLARLIAPEER